MNQTAKRLTWFVLKLAVSASIMVWIFRKVVQRQEAHELARRVSELSWPWIAVAVAMQLGAITCSITRWDRLLVGQGIDAPIRHLIGSFFVGRFLGAFTPGGWTGLNGYRIYDIAKHTGKTARSATAIGIEMLLGQMAFGVVVIAGSVVGFRFIGMQGVVLVDLFFVGLIAAVLLLLTRPGVFSWLAAKLPAAAQARLRSILDAVSAYRGKGGLLATATALGVGTHTFNNLVFVATARALGTELSVADVFFVSAMQIFATLIPASINGIGLREATAVALYTRVGVPVSEAALIPMIGFAVEMAVSSFGGVVLLLRSSAYRPIITVADDERESRVRDQGAAAQLPLSLSQVQPPTLSEALPVALLGGITAGVVVGVTEALVIMVSSASEVGVRTLWYAATVYGLLYGVISASAVGTFAWLRARSGLGKQSRRVAFARTTATGVAVSAWVLGAFRIRRDVFHEELVWKSAQGLAVLVGCMVVAAALYVALSWSLRKLAPSRAAALVCGLCVLTGALVPLVASSKPHESAALVTNASSSPAASAGGAASGHPNVLLIVVDTLRADRLPTYGYAKGTTPNLDAFARDSVVFTHAFANSSWTRPSFATILTGRFASSHKTMGKSDVLPSEIDTLPEVLKRSGYHTAGFVTNYNVAPFFNFHQGFDAYHYLEPEFVLGADDTAAKLLWVQFAKQKIEKWRAARGHVEPGTAYQDAETVNRHVFSWLEQKAAADSANVPSSPSSPKSPWFLFVGYMDPHDPYFPHPYNGSGYARAAHASPSLEEAPVLSALYDGEIQYWDEHFGRLIQKLKDLGLYDNLAIVVTSDHGEEFGEHGGFWHGTTLYDEQVHVPLLLKLPGSGGGSGLGASGQAPNQAPNQAGVRISNWVQLVDIMPTVLRIAKVPAPQAMQGLDLFEGTHEVFAEESHEGNVLSSVRTRHGDATWKLIHANDGNPRGLQAQELYRVDRDPRESTNLAVSEAPALQSQQTRLADYQKRAVQGAAERATVDIAKDSTTIDRLRALGYVDESQPAGSATLKK
jgi:arylsulfatase A-like enzyme/uncharacterized membrane protein YbhN (UPF0104 family)